MATPSQIVAAKRALPIATLALSDAPQDIKTQGAALILDIGQSVENRAATQSALHAFSAGTTRLGSRYAVLAVPVAGEAIGAAVLAYDVLKLGWRGVTGQSFEETAIGRNVTRASNGAWHAALGGLALAMDYAGMPATAKITRGWFSEVMTGSPAWGNKSATNPAIPLPSSPSTTPGTTPLVSTILTPGPTRAMSTADWDEPPLQQRGNTAIRTTTPLRRAQATMDLLVADIGLPPSSRLTEPVSQIAPAAIRTTQRGAER